MNIQTILVTLYDSNSQTLSIVEIGGLYMYHLLHGSKYLYNSCKQRASAFIISSSLFTQALSVKDIFVREKLADLCKFIKQIGLLNFHNSEILVD